MDSIVTVTIGVIKGVGKQAQATVAYVVCFYLISVPASFYFCFNLALGLRGLYMGLSTGLVILVAALILIVWKADWQRIAHLAKENYLKECLLVSVKGRYSTLAMLEELDSSSKRVNKHFYCSSSGSASEEEERSS